MENEKSGGQSNEEQQKPTAEEIQKATEEDTRLWLTTDEKVKTYLSGFNQYYVDNFIKYYPSEKARFVRFGAELGDLPEKHQIAYLNQAYERLADIQAKKIFDVMCQWDANLLQIDGIVCSWDFSRWENNELFCPFITPISEEEIRLYMSYTNSPDFVKKPYINITQYNNYRNENEKYDTIPEWFLFENIHTGNNKYLVLPKLRTEKEFFYRRLWRKEEDEKIEQRYESGELARPVKDDRPAISTHKYNDVERFVALFEDKETLLLFKKYYAYFTDQLIRENPEEEREGWLTERVDDIIHQLTGIKEKLPIEASSDWREGLIQAYEKYEIRKIREAIPYAYSDYLMRQELNIANSKIEEGDFYDDLANQVCNQILRGRELNGEPRDFNF